MAQVNGASKQHNKLRKQTRRRKNQKNDARKQNGAVAKPCKRPNNQLHKCFLQVNYIL
jgi:hypothetical protein